MIRYMLCLFSILLWLPNLKAQTTISLGKRISPGDTFKYYLVDTTNLVPGGNGQTAVWDFHNLTINSTMQKMVYLAPASTPYAGLFPTADLVKYDSTSQSFTFYDTSLKKMERLGQVKALDTTYLSNTATEMRYPLMPDSNFTDSFAWNSAQGTIKYDYNGYTSVWADAYGRIILPNGQFSNVLRVYRNESLRTTVTDNTGTNTENQNLRSYHYYLPNGKFPVLSLYTLAVGGGFYRYAHYSPAQGLQNTGIQDNSVNQAISFHVLPNPINGGGTLIIPMERSSGLRISLANALVQEIKEIYNNRAGAGMFQTTINTENMPKGIYYLQIRMDDKAATQKLIVE